LCRRRPEVIVYNVSDQWKTSELKKSGYSRNKMAWNAHTEVNTGVHWTPVNKIQYKTDKLLVGWIGN